MPKNWQLESITGIYLEKDLVEEREWLELEALSMLYTVCKALGLWAYFHDAGTGAHLHVQGGPPGG